ncbi:MAG TPA: DUF924 family protein [Hyphomicrobiales bacterium]|nr:DUF924 family protein [Hyphomicrobiales bacterium]
MAHEANKAGLPTRQDVLHFWFEEVTPQDWFARSEALDAALTQRFSGLHASAARGELFGWRDTVQGRLAEILVLDQFSRNLHRDTAGAFAYDAMALVLAQEAVAQGLDAQLDIRQLPFLYMPYMHSESPLIQQESLRLFDKTGLEYSFDFARRHKEIIDRFGRYPHRNVALARTSTAEELAFLQEPGSSF